MHRWCPCATLRPPSLIPLGQDDAPLGTVRLRIQLLCHVGSSYPWNMHHVTEQHTTTVTLSVAGGAALYTSKFRRLGTKFTGRGSYEEYGLQVQAGETRRWEGELTGRLCIGSWHASADSSTFVYEIERPTRPRIMVTNPAPAVG
jgi:hypothetical protein